MGFFADDTTLYTLTQHQNNTPASSASMQSTLDNLSRWGHQWRIQFEPTKSQLMHIDHHRHPWPRPPLSFGNHVLNPTDELKLLGVTFDRKLSFRLHVRGIALRAASRIGFLRRASRFLDTRSLLATYRGFVRPVLKFGCFI